MYQKHELFAELSSVDIAETLKACALEQKDEYMEDEADRFRECRALIEQGKTYKQAAAQFRKQDKLKESGDAQPDTNALEMSQLLVLASEQMGARISLIEAGKILSACGLPDKEEYTGTECDRFIEACTLVKQQNKTYEEIAAHFGIAHQQSKSNAHSILLDEVRQLLSQPAFSQAEQIREALPQMAVEQLEEIKALFWQMTAQRLRQYVDSGQLEAEIRQASKSVLATNSGKLTGAVGVKQQPESEAFAWLIDECIQQRITVIATTDRQLIEINNYKLRERAKAIALEQRLDKARMERWRLWLKWTFGNLHRASNRITFFYLIWTPLVMFYSAIAFMAMPTAVLCPEPNGICHNMRVLSLEAKKTLTLPQRLWEESKKK